MYTATTIISAMLEVNALLESPQGLHSEFGQHHTILHTYLGTGEICTDFLCNNAPLVGGKGLSEAVNLYKKRKRQKKIGNFRWNIR
jgi:hypothetical protein